MNGAMNAVSALILGGSLVAGLVLGGEAIGKGTARFRADARTVTVKGLVEREVPSDEAVWKLTLRLAGNEPAELHGRFRQQRDVVLAFLRRQGFGENEIVAEPPRTLDKQAREYGSAGEREQFRYVVTSALVVRTTKVPLVQTALGSTEELLRAGIILDGEHSGQANPQYRVTRFNDLRPELLAEATKNARTMAEQFAADSGTRVGRLRSANQGMIQIFGTDGHDESGPFSAFSTPVKKIRVVSTLEFDLE